MLFIMIGKNTVSNQNYGNQINDTFAGFNDWIQGRENIFLKKTNMTCCASCALISRFKYIWQ